jgi:hypothetical protein
MFDFVLGLDRWVARVVAYAGLMTDAYPPFRLDQGGADPVGIAPGAPSEVVPPEPGAAAPAAPEGGSRAGRIALVVLGAIASILAFGLLAGGCSLVVVDQALRDDDGFVMSPSEDLRTPTYAIVSEEAEFDTEGAEWALETFLGTVRLRAESEAGRDIFIGIGREDRVSAYLRRVEHDVITDIDDPEYERRPGGSPRTAPTDTVWEASASGSGEQTLEWEPEDGDWRAVIMNADGSRGVSAEASIGAEIDSLLWIGIGLLVAGGLLAAGGALAITAGVRRRPPPAS